MAREDTAALYDQDFFEWTARNAELLRQGCVHEADLEHLAEEIEDLGKRDKNGVENRLVVLVMHLLKWKYQPERRYTATGASSWLSTITEQRRRLRSIFKQSPSLKGFARTALLDVYPDAVKRASAETGIPIRQFPSECPFTFDQVLEDEFLPV
jgi:hypothetical protein